VPIRSWFLSALFSIPRFGADVKKEFEKIMTVRMKAAEHRMLSERAQEVGASFSRYLIECGLFECGLRQGILTPEDREVLQFVAFQVAKVGTNLNQIARRLNAASGTIDLNHLDAALTEIRALSGSLKCLIGEAEMGAAMIKVTVGRAGHGAANVAYITRLSALNPEEHRREQEEQERGLTGYSSYISREGALEPGAAQSIEEVLDEKALAENEADKAKKEIDGDPIWTWNAPEYVTGDMFGSEEYFERMREREASRPLLAQSEPVSSADSKISQSRNKESQLVPVSEDEPCPVCKGSSWCSISADGMKAFCRRVESDSRTANSGYLHVLTDSGRLLPNRNIQGMQGASGGVAEEVERTGTQKPGRVIRGLPKQQRAQDEFLKKKIEGSREQVQRGLTLKEKVAGARTYFGSLEEFEKAKGGRTHYRVVLSFDRPATNREIRELTNGFLADNFPKALAFPAIHRDTDHPHVHIYIHSRQINGKRIHLENDDYRRIDERWAKRYAEWVQEREIYEQHIEKKLKTLQWKRAAELARQRGEPIPPKPERVADRYQQLAERRLSGQRSQAADRGERLGQRPAAEPLMRPHSERETSRLLAREHIAREELSHLIRTDAAREQIEIATRRAERLTDALHRTLNARQELGRERLPEMVYTREERRRLTEYELSRNIVKDDRLTSRLLAHQEVAQAEVRDAHVGRTKYQARRQFWKFTVEGHDGKWSLLDVEREIKEKEQARLTIHNFMRPSVRAEMEKELDNLQELKWKIQQQLIRRDEVTSWLLRIKELQAETINQEVERVREARGELGLAIPEPTFSGEVKRIVEIANRNRDAGLLRQLHERRERERTVPPSRETVALMVGRERMAHAEMLSAGERALSAARFRDVSQVIVRDAEGRDELRSVRDARTEGSPGEQQRVKTAADAHVKRAEAEYERATKYYEVRHQIAEDYARAARLKPGEVAPILAGEDSRRLSVLSDERLLAKETIARAELADAEERLRRFEVKRHLVPFPIDREEVKWSLLEVEGSLKSAAEQRDVKRVELSAIKEQVQKLIVQRGAELQHQSILSERRVALLTSAVEPVLVERARAGRGLPDAQYTPNEVTRLEKLAQQTHDGALLRHVEEAAGRGLEPVRRASQNLNRMLVARAEMLKAAERMVSARQFRQTGHVVIRDEHGRDSVRSVRESTSATRCERAAIDQAANSSLRYAERHYLMARSYYKATRELFDERSRAAVVPVQEVKQVLRPEIEAAKNYTDERIVAKHQITEAELTDARLRSEEFASLRHLMKFELKGEQQRWSLNDVERELARKQKDGADVVNLLLPGKGKEIDRQLERLVAIKRLVQQTIKVREMELVFKTEIAEQSAKILRAAIEDIRSERTAAGQVMPAPRYTADEQLRLAEVARRHRDAALLEHVHEALRVGAGTRPTHEGVREMAGQALLARVEMLKAADRLETAKQYRGLRRVPFKDVTGRDQAKSVRQVEPRSAIEAVYKMLTVKPEVKREREAVKRAAEAQIERKLQEYERARCYYKVRQKIVDDLRVEGAMKEVEIAPQVHPEQLKAIKEYVRALPALSRERRELKQEIARAETQARLPRRENLPGQDLTSQEKPTTSPRKDSSRIQSQNRLPRTADNLSQQPIDSTQIVAKADKTSERTEVMKARGEALVVFSSYWMEKERQKSGLSHKIVETGRELIKADARATELINAYTALYNEKAPPALLDREQNELINKSMWIIKDEDARHRLSFEGQHAQFVYEQKESKTHERGHTIDQDTYGWER
jgi:hypothetical protein